MTKERRPAKRGAAKRGARKPERPELQPPRKMLVVKQSVPEDLRAQLTALMLRLDRIEWRMENKLAAKALPESSAPIPKPEPAAGLNPPDLSLRALRERHALRIAGDDPFRPDANSGHGSRELVRLCPECQNMCACARRHQQDFEDISALLELVGQGERTDV